jgi:hypothetical protein
MVKVMMLQGSLLVLSIMGRVRPIICWLEGLLIVFLFANHFWVRCLIILHCALHCLGRHRVRISRRRCLVQCTDGWTVHHSRTTATPGARGNSTPIPRPLLLSLQLWCMHTRMTLMRLRMRLNSFCWVLPLLVVWWLSSSLSLLQTQIEGLSL